MMMQLHELQQQHKERLQYRVDNDKYSSVNASVKIRIVQEVFTCTFSEEECITFEKIFREYLNINGGQSYDKLKNDLIIASKRYFQVNQYPAIQCMLFCSKCVPSKRFDKKLVETLSNVIENMIQYVDFEDFQSSIVHIVRQWANWIPQLQVAIRISYRLNDTEFLRSVFNNMFSDDELYWEVFFMLIRSGKSEFIPIIIDEIISASTETDKNKQIKNIFKNHFADYYNIDEATGYYNLRYRRDRFLGTGQRRVEEVLNMNTTQNELSQKAKSLPPNQQLSLFKEQFDRLKKSTPNYNDYMSVFSAALTVSERVKAEISSMMFDLLIDKSRNKGTPLSILKEMIYRLATNRYSDAQDFITKQFGNNKDFIGAVACYDLYVSRITSEKFASNFLLEQNDKVVKGYVDAFKILYHDNKTSKEICKYLVTYLNAILDNRSDNTKFQTNISTAIFNLKKAIWVNNLLFDREFKRVFETLFGFNGTLVEPLVESDCLIAILEIINRVFKTHNIFEPLLFSLYNGENVAAVLRTHAGGILSEHGRKAIPVKKEGE